MKTLKVTVLGAGSWGTALTHLVARQGHQVKLWAREAEVVEGINRTRHNPLFMSEAELPEGVTATGDLGEAVRDAEMVLVLIPSQFVRSHMVAIRDDLPAHIPVVICSKGIEQDTLCTMHQVLAEELPGKHHEGISVLSGPSFAAEDSQREIDFILGNFEFVLLHELAHVIIVDKDVPILGPLESAADYASIAMVIRGDGSESTKQFLDRALADAAKSFATTWRLAEANGIGVHLCRCKNEDIITECCHPQPEKAAE